MGTSLFVPGPSERSNSALWTVFVRSVILHCCQSCVVELVLLGPDLTTQLLITGESDFCADEGYMCDRVCDYFLHHYCFVSSILVSAESACFSSVVMVNEGCSLVMSVANQCQYVKSYVSVIF